MENYNAEKIIHAAYSAYYSKNEPNEARSTEGVDGTMYYWGVKCLLPCGNKFWQARHEFHAAVKIAIVASCLKSRKARRAYLAAESRVSRVSRYKVAIRDYNRVRGIAIRQHAAFVAALRAAGENCDTKEVLKALYA